MPHVSLLAWNNISLLLLALYALDRAWKLACIARFFRQPAPPVPSTWPRVSLIQPITAGASGLAHNLNARARLEYPGEIEHLLVCDAHDEETLAVCHAWLEAWPELDARVLFVPNEVMRKASKIEKMQVGVERANGNVFCFVDDDVAPRPDNLACFARHLGREQAGSVFGLACYTNWNAMGSCLMSSFVNANALASYIPLTFLTEPYTITGHFFAIRRDVFSRSGGLDGMESLLCDDHEIARRIRSFGFNIVQTPVIYDVNNELPTWGAFHRQIHRWFVFTGRVLWPLTPPFARFVSALFSLASLFPGLLLGLALFARTTQTVAALAGALLLTALMTRYCETWYAVSRSPLYNYLSLCYVTLITPWQALGTLFSGKAVLWRGQRIRVFPDNTYEVIS